MRRAATGALAAAVLGATVLAGPAQAGPRATGAEGQHRPTQAALQRLVDHAGMPGVGALARRDGRTWFGRAGAADVESGRPRSAADHYRIASVTKSFVATVLLQLEAEGELSLTDTVEDWLPGVVRGNGNDGRRITLRQLLQHTSGLFNFTEDPGLQRTFVGRGFLQHRYDTHDRRAVLAAALGHPPLFPPGSSWSYSNTNYLLAGLVIERATERPYAKEVTDRIIRPLKLRETRFPGTDPELPDPHPVAYSTLWDQAPDAKVHDATAYNTTMWAASADLVSTSGDIRRFYGALLRGELLPRAQMAAMFDTVAVPDAPAVRFGLGVLSLRLSCGKTVWGHNGSLQGTLTTALGTRDGGHQLVFHVNGDWLTEETQADYYGVAEAEFCGTRPGTVPPPSFPALR